MYLDRRGSGSPVVIFDAGAGGWSKDWAPVHDEIAKTTMACAYDRPGHGLSDPRPLPLDTKTVADDLDAMLSAAGIAPPYVLVGHSLGSYHVRQYANTRFDKMAGMVLVDPSADGQKAKFSAALPHFVAELGKREEAAKAVGCIQRLREKLVLRADPLFAQCNGTNDPDLFEQTQSEIDSMEGASTAQLTASRRSYGDMPLIVLTRGDNDKGMPPELTKEDREGFVRIWTGFHEEMTALSSAGERRVIPGAGHYIQGDKPQAVIDAVNEVVAKARSRAPAP
jgi:pimeloyl-ACP methyl ester carboxylesterase